MFALRQATRPLARQASRLNPASSHLLSTNANAKSKSKEEEELINMFQTMPNEHLGNSYDLNWTLCAIDIFNSGSLNYKINSPRNLFAISEDMKKKFESMDHKVPAGLDAGKEPMAGADMSFDDYEELYEVATEFMSDDEVTKKIFFVEGEKKVDNKAHVVRVVTNCETTACYALGYLDRTPVVDQVKVWKDSREKFRADGKIDGLNDEEIKEAVIAANLPTKFEPCEHGVVTIVVKSGEKGEAGKLQKGCVVDENERGDLVSTGVVLSGGEIDFREVVKVIHTSLKGLKEEEEEEEKKA